MVNPVIAAKDICGLAAVGDMVRFSPPERFAAFAGRIPPLAAFLTQRVESIPMNGEKLYAAVWARDSMSDERIKELVAVGMGVAGLPA